MNDVLVAQIVEQVLKEIQQPTPPLRTPKQNHSQSTLISHSVITADVLEQQVTPGSQIEVAAGSLVTPAAKDWLREHKVVWQRASRSASGQSTSRNTTNSNNSTQRLKVLIVNDFNRLKQLTADVNKTSAHCWSAELANDNRSAADKTIAELSRGSIEKTLIVSTLPELVACEANRHPGVKAAVVERAERVTAVQQSLQPNCFCINPTGKSYFELRNLLRAIDKAI